MKQKCKCGKCAYCYNHTRYLKNIDVFKQRSRIRNIQIRNRIKDLMQMPLEDLIAEVGYE